MYAVCKVTSLYWSVRYHIVCIAVDLGTSHDQVISKTIKLVFVASPLSTEH